MGNCLKKETVAEWGGEEWESLNSNNKCKRVHFDEHVEVFGEDRYEDELENESGRGGMEQVRIRISKKQFEELIRKVEVKSLSLHEMMSHLVENGTQQDDEHKAWRPLLKTIPENVNFELELEKGYSF